MVNFQAVKQGRFCKGKCDNYRMVLNTKGGKKYETNARCTCCSVWMPKEMVVMSGIYYRCPCCNQKVRRKTWKNKNMLKRNMDRE